MNEIDFWVNFLANGLTIIASGIAIYIFLRSKDKIASVLNVILNYSLQLTLSELRNKIERLNEYKADNEGQMAEVVNILNEIEGQIMGSKILESALAEQLTKIAKFTSNPKTLTEPKKRSLVAELREKLRHMDVSNYRKMVN